jgi:hypothetical protein
MGFTFFDEKVFKEQWAAWKEKDLQTYMFGQQHIFLGNKTIALISSIKNGETESRDDPGELRPNLWFYFADFSEFYEIIDEFRTNHPEAVIKIAYNEKWHFPLGISVSHCVAAPTSLNDVYKVTVHVFASPPQDDKSSNPIDESTSKGVPITF